MSERLITRAGPVPVRNDLAPPGVLRKVSGGRENAE